MIANTKLKTHIQNVTKTFMITNTKLKIHIQNVTKYINDYKYKTQNTYTKCTEAYM